jgi:protein phosphatase 1 regulatory subunit 21
VQPASNNSQQTYKMTVLDENGVQASSLQVSKEDKERENNIRQFYESKIHHLTGQVQIADAKAVELYETYQHTAEELKKLHDERDLLQKKIEQTANEVSTAKEDLEVTRKNYEQQMNVLTEHITNMNDRVARQEDQLDFVKASKVYCGKCKKWNTIAWLLEEGKNGQRCSGGNHGSYFNYV